MKNNPSSELPWLMMLAAADSKKNTIHMEIFQELEEMAMNEQEIREALIEWETISANKENKVLYEARLKYLRDQLSNIRGERKEGKVEERRQIATEMLKEGLSMELITKITKLAISEIENLKKNL